MHALSHARTRASSSTSKIPHVAVVGAGISGLRCSDVLSRSGVKVTLFEARNRIGGRVHQASSGGYLMDMGPNWIHGTKGNPIMNLASKTGTTVMEPEEEGALFDRHGRRRPDPEAIELSSKIWEMVVDAFKHSDERSSSIDPGTSLFQYFQAQLSRAGIDGPKRDDLLHEAQMWGPFVGDSVEKQSLKFFFLEECIEGENVFVASTYSAILREIGRTVTESNKIDLLLETEIVHCNFETSPDGENEAITHTVTLTTSTGHTCTFDEVVITCPLGWLKRYHTSAFTPKLPSRLSSAIEHINYGRLEKLYVTFPEAFWLSPFQDAETDSTHIHAHTRGRDTSSHPIFTHFHDPSYIPHPETEKWNQSVVSLAHLPSPHAHPTLLFYIYGPCATHVVQSIQSLPPHSPQYNETLRLFAEPFYALLPGYHPNDPICTPTSFLMTQWQADPFAGHGSYCNFQVGLERGDEDIEVMRSAGGLNEQGLWLAGEHTAPFIALGTTTGAWWSGEGVARRICDKYGIKIEVADDDGADDGAGGMKKMLDGDRSKADAANLNGLAI
ncbi:uncharacterized protein Z518_06262 [Rhinocladiella mackenziei CBS 650.93]|uniref:Amine oxidase domain-containing protein n=1 Tax=Rhinocladiella mackenziei CBS 650.93 TaxID=1442369 RepID=A0A0D2J8G5_9EURO|nr:uncharacterized protein Z518_06262 [Rhinocladiella mackenziei CBS 650.93]KIX05390.1 hypothetical protein Z518_06262 [Rhinocladiella mackenziei CBS 650.93]